MTDLGTAMDPAEGMVIWRIREYAVRYDPSSSDASGLVDLVVVTDGAFDYRQHGLIRTQRCEEHAQEM